MKSEGEVLALIPRRLNLAVRPTTVSLMILDGSQSMQKFKEAPKEAVEGHIKKLRDDPTRYYLCSVVGFADNSYVIVPLKPVDEIEGIKYEPDGNTLLWKTVGDVLEQLLKFYTSQVRGLQEHLKVVVGVFSDGGDNRSPEGYLIHLKYLSEQALSYGWELMTFGIGIDAEALAESMGFPTDPDHAVTVEATEEGLHESVINMTHTTMGFGFRPKDSKYK